MKISIFLVIYDYVAVFENTENKKEKLRKTKHITSVVFYHYFIFVLFYSNGFKM